MFNASLSNFRCVICEMVAERRLKTKVSLLAGSPLTPLRTLWVTRTSDEEQSDPVVRSLVKIRQESSSSRGFAAQFCARSSVARACVPEWDCSQANYQGPAERWHRSCRRFLSFFQRYIVRDIPLTWDISLLRYFWECSLAHWNLIRHFEREDSQEKDCTHRDNGGSGTGVLGHPAARLCEPLGTQIPGPRTPRCPGV